MAVKKKVVKKATKKAVKKKVTKKSAKKVVRKASAKKVAKRKPVKKVAPKTMSSKKPQISQKVRIRRATNRKIKIVLQNLFAFLILFILSFVIYSVSIKDIYVNFFFITTVIFGVVTIAFVIVLLTLYFLRALRK